MKIPAMARLLASTSFTGTVGNVTIYRMFGQYYIRSRSSLTARRVKKDPAFRATMQYAALLARASRIASRVYAAVPAPRKKHPLYRKLTGEVITWLKYGWEENDIFEYLTGLYAGSQPVIDWPATKLQWRYRSSNSVTPQRMAPLRPTVLSQKLHLVPQLCGTDAAVATTPPGVP